MPETLSCDVSELTAFQDKFLEYARYNKREMPDLITKQAKEASEQLFIDTPRAHAGQIQSKLESLGYRFIRAPRGFSTQIAAQDGTVKDTITKLQRKERVKLFNALGIVRKGKESTKKAITRTMRENPALAKQYTQSLRLTIEEQRRAAFLYRKAHIGATAASWGPAMMALGSKMRIASSSHGKPLGGVNIALEDERPSVEIWSLAPGIVDLNASTGFVTKVIRERIADMQVYIDRKKAEAATVFHR